MVESTGIHQIKVPYSARIWQFDGGGMLQRTPRTPRTSIRIDKKRRKQIERWAGKEGISLKELAEKMFIDREGRDRDSTIHGNRRLLGRVFPLVGEKPVASITASDINEVLRKLREPMVQDRKHACVGRKTLNGKLSGASMNRFRFLLSGVFTYGIANRYLAKNPVADTKPFAKGERRVRFLSNDEEAAVRQP